MSDHEEEYGEEEIKETPLDYNEKNEEGFSVIEFQIYESLTKEKLAHEAQHAGEEEPEPFDYSAWQEGFKEKNPRVDDKYIKYVSLYGIYSGERDELQVRSGTGKSLFPNGDQYIGNFEEGLRSGQGRYVYISLGPISTEQNILSIANENEQISSLIQENNLEEASKLIGKTLKEKSTIIPSKNQTPVQAVDSFYRIYYTLKYQTAYSFYDGEFRQNENEGRGVLKYKNGDVYNGEWKQGKKHGYGELYYQNGDVYKGEWFEGFKHGSGSYYFTKFNCTYEGEWKNGKFVQGFWKMPDGISYQGSFEDVPIDVNGHFSFSDGVKMFGEFRDRKFRPSNRFTIESRGD